MPVYTNATDVLPLELLTEVQKRWQGLLYVPPQESEPAADPHEAVLLAIQSGCSARDVTLIYGIPKSTVYRIAQRLGKLNPYADPSRHLGGRPRHSPDSK